MLTHLYFTRARTTVCALAAAFVFSLVSTMTTTAKAANLAEAIGHVTLLRVHDVGTQYGPPGDQIDVEVIVFLDTQPGKAFGFQLRTDGNQAARQGMLNLLQQAFVENWTVTIDYNIDPGKNNGVIIRTWATK